MPDGAADGAAAAVPASAALFILSFRHRDELASVAARAGLPCIAARRVEAVDRRFLASGAAVLVIDARGSLDEGLAALSALAAPAESACAAVLVLISRGDVRALDRVYAAGATHYLASPFGEAELVQALRFARRHADRLAGRSPREGQPAAPMTVAQPRRPVGGRDPLTGLADQARARSWIAAAASAERPVTLLLAALARFDEVNASYGRAVGDALLVAAGRRVERLARDMLGRNAMVARVAGPEFAVAVSDGIERDRARLLASQIASALTRPFVADGALLTMGAHVGLATSDGEAVEPAALLRRAAAAVAQARAADGDPVAEMREEDELATRLEADLREAIAGEGIEILFQPQVRVVDGAVTGVEALARWKHPELGWLGAETLFAAAERAGLVLPLSREVQTRAIAAAAAWPDALSRLRLSINVTAADIAQPDFCERIVRLADDHGFPRARLTVEVTESGLIADLESAADLLANLRAAGCRVAIDDFGTGYSSLAYLKALPLDDLKIDRRLAQDIAGSPRDRIVVRSVIDLARSLGLRVIAEGVETEEQLALLAAEGCTTYQGFLCAGPMDVAGLETLVAGGGCRIGVRP